MTQTDDHNWFEQAMAAYLIDGLPAEERNRFERHAAECATCAMSLAELRDLDQSMMSLFANTRPPAGLEDRTIERLRRERTMRLRVNPFVRRAAVSAAAVVTLGLLGVVATQVMEGYGIEVAALPDPLRNYNQQREDQTWFAEYGLTRKIESPVSSAAPATNAPKVSDDLVALGNQKSGVTYFLGGEFKNKDIKADAPSVAVENGRISDEIVIGNRAIRARDRANEKSEKSLDDELKRRRADFDAQFLERMNQPEERRIPYGNEAIDTPASDESPNQRHIIRNGEMEFEVERFDTGLALVTKITEEEGGFVATTNSEKLDNGKTRGVIVVRIAPEKLNTLAAKLRALGELRRQSITAQEITKQYTDLESRLRAARAMEERLLEILKTGKGEMKELLAVETQLGATREKIELIEGEIRYYDNLTSLAMLTVTLAEKDIQAPASIIETQEINLVVAVGNVEQARADLMKQIESAGGRVVTSRTEQLPDGAFAGTVVVILPVGKDEPVIERLREGGYLTEMNRSISQAAVDGRPVDADVRIDRKEVRLSVRMVDLISTTPRETVRISAASYDVAAMYNALARIGRTPQARMRSAQLVDAQPNAVSGVWQVDLPSEKVAEVERVILEHGAISSRDVIQSESPARMDGRTHIALTIADVDQLAARQTLDVALQTSDVEASRRKILQSIGSDRTRIISSTIARQTDDTMLATLQFEVPIDRADELLAQIRANGKVQDQSSQVNENVPLNTIAKAHFNLKLSTRDAIVSGERGVWASIRQGLSTSVAGLLWSLQMVVIGFCFVLPWAMVIWIIHRIFRKRNKPAPEVADG